MGLPLEVYHLSLKLTLKQYLSTYSNPPEYWSGWTIIIIIPWKSSSASYPPMGIGASFWLRDAFAHTNQLGLGKWHWNLETSSAVVEFLPPSLRVLDNNNSNNNNNNDNKNDNRTFTSPICSVGSVIHAENEYFDNWPPSIRDLIPVGLELPPGRSSWSRSQPSYIQTEA